MTVDSTEERSAPTLRFRKSELKLDFKFWLAVVFIVVIVVVSVLISLHQPWVGLGTGACGVLGALLGVLLQATPLPVDYTTNGASAVRGLLGAAQDLENVRVQTTSLVSEVESDPNRVKVGLVDTQNRLEEVISSLYVSMAEWDNIAPGALAEVDKLNNAGRDALKMLQRKGTDV
ncbi:hypothetical protein IT072_09805 [Leifsonia sp. ZF2019]|uniref:hypothetical protein n=1 Tax=Leifsonia sp. ZF2019 TaxID=2781978 RepID=UPI001CBFCD45|nr:hypothetical protein [Leifsonia sp. ZF2019]UAJ81240.1 hypothetical protein IT072_09805 [Leifsonia sp. ZF2019]